MAAGVSHVLVVSLGNPAPYLHTLHSAGHAALEALRRELRLPAFVSSRRSGGRGGSGGSSGKETADARYTLVQSPTLMNVSGPWVARTWREALKQVQKGGTGSAGAEAVSRLGLVVVHDELEEELGAVVVRPWTRSHRGHNGLKSVQASLRPGEYPGARWAKLAVGIGRPAARDAATVADYVLQPMTERERDVLERGGSDLGSRLLAALRGLETQWADDATAAESAQAATTTAAVGADTTSSALPPGSTISRKGKSRARIK
ncbi:peptidyl-tRNA hydrolase 2 [Niveomyces insectorum RCEF 264]|uniref:peptidyl-tRNA hydrolase n=1 Tax=Niveomyces insectorum RCEF 264 TaxID=1081102 RepID=A0A167XW36_9HYPO|nr:peptidyl-tRNA hydrolase 2 [Niveomyces insectorum RCEF 264]